MQEPELRVVRNDQPVNEADQPSQVILGPSGKPANAEPEIILTREQRVAAMRKEVEAILDSKEFQAYATSMVLGTQLYAWAHHYILKELPGSTQAKLSVIATVNASMMDKQGNPHPFDEARMAKILGEELPFIEKTTAKHVREVERREKEVAEFAKDLDNQIRQSTGGEQPAPTT